MKTTLDQQPAARPRHRLGLFRALTENTEARQAAARAAEQAAESRKRLAADRERIAADQTAFMTEMVALAFQFGRLQGRAEALREQITEMAAKAGSDG